MTNTLQALSGITVLEFGDFYASAATSYHLRLLGAAVMLAEPPEGCELRRLAQRHPASTLFAHAARGWQSVSLDAIPDADIVLLPAWPTPQAEAALTALRERDKAGRTITISFREMDGTQLTDLTAQAEIGMSTYLGRQSEPPLRVGMEMLGASAGMLATQAVLAALRARRLYGRGQQIVVPLSRVMACILNNVISASLYPEQTALFSQVWKQPPALGFHASDGSAEIRFYGPKGETGFPEFCRHIGAHAVADDPGFRYYRDRLDRHAELVGLLKPYTSAMTRDELVTLAHRYHAMATPKYDLPTAREWEQTRANNMVEGPPGSRLVAAPWEINGVRPYLSERL